MHRICHINIEFVSKSLILLTSTHPQFSFLPLSYSHDSYFFTVFYDLDHKLAMGTSAYFLFSWFKLMNKKVYYHYIQNFLLWPNMKNRKSFSYCKNYFNVVILWCIVGGTLVIHYIVTHCIAMYYIVHNVMYTVMHKMMWMSSCKL